MRKVVFLWRSEKPLFHTVPRWVRLFLGVFLGAYALVCAALWTGQREMLFHPMPRGDAIPGNALNSMPSGLQFWRAEASLSAKDSPASMCPASPSGKRGAVAYFGGNGDAASRFAERAIKELPGCDLYALNYPGYEGAAGSPSETSIHAAADAMMARMAEEGVDLSLSIAMGRSLGSGEAARQASLRPMLMAVLITPYDSLAAVAQDSYPWAPISLLMRDPFDAIPWAKAAQSPALILFADNDEVIPAIHAHVLAKAWNPVQGNRLGSVVGTTHGNILSSGGIWDSIRNTLSGYRTQIANLPHHSAVPAPAK